MPVKRKKWFKILLIVVLSFVVLLCVLFPVYYRLVVVYPPNIYNEKALLLERDTLSDTSFRIASDWLRKDSSGLWEMYLSGNPFELGVKNGKLASELVQYQEKAFVDLLREKIPNEFYIGFLKYFVALFNRNLDDCIPLDYQKEIYGVSLSAGSEFDFIGSKYQRILNYHAAHDIGHALQNLNMVACTSFGVWDEYSQDSNLVIGRNFDFYAGDAFAENKIVLFVHPDTGFDFAIITWGGMIGAVSGMNQHGLTLTLNAAKSDIPAKASTPVSIIARQILQYAANIDEAFEIAKSFDSFVSESFLIGSAKDHAVAIIEKSLDTTVLFRQEKNYIISTNHFQDKAFAGTDLNIQNIANQTSTYRMARVDELIRENMPIDYLKSAEILRNKKGLKNKDIGLTNEKAINQLIAHHSVIFKPEQGLMWVSTQPYQLGSYICYDLNKVFDRSFPPGVFGKITIDSLNIPCDTFLLSQDYKIFQLYKNTVSSAKKYERELSPDELNEFIHSNPEYYYTYVQLGDYYFEQQEYPNSLKFYNFALQKEISSKIELEKILEKIRQLQNDTRN